MMKKVHFFLDKALNTAIITPLTEDTLMKFLLALMLSVASFTTFAHNVADIQPTIVMDFESNQNESYTDFVMRVGRFMNGWTKDSNAEICGILTEKNGQYFVILGTINSQLSCNSNKIVSGTTPTGDNIHSHPATMVGNRLKITDATRKIEGDRVPQVTFTVVNTKIFSENDYKAGNGFLVANDLVQYQNGIGTVKVIGQLPKAGE